jgi:hypothetical protein
MRYFMGIFLRRTMGLTAALIIAAAVPVQAGLLAGPNAPESGLVLLAQNTEPTKDKQPGPPPQPPAKEPKKLKTMGGPPSPQMERMDKSVIRDEPGKAGTKKIGGQAIRAKETPGGE